MSGTSYSGMVTLGPDGDRGRPEAFPVTLFGTSRLCFFKMFGTLAYDGRGDLGGVVS